jgi:hypothetical protein
VYFTRLLDVSLGKVECWLYIVVVVVVTTTTTTTITTTILLLLLLLLAAIELSLADSSPYTSTDKINKNKCM